MGLSTLKIEIRRQILDHLLLVVGGRKRFHLLKRVLFIGKVFVQTYFIQSLEEYCGSPLVSTLAGWKIMSTILCSSFIPSINNNYWLIFPPQTHLLLAIFPKLSIAQKRLPTLAKCCSPLSSPLSLEGPIYSENFFS